jgi:addiction module HigA family antidote
MGLTDSRIHRVGGSTSLFGKQKRTKVTLDESIAER